MPGRSEAWWNEPYRPGKWQRRQVLGHLIDSASNNHQRFVRALIQDAYDGPAYDQEGCVRVERFDLASMDVLIALFCSYNRLLSHVVANFPPEKLGTICRVGTYPEMTLEELAIDYVAHLEHHLTQIFGTSWQAAEKRLRPNWPPYSGIVRRACSSASVKK